MRPIRHDLLETFPHALCVEGDLRTAILSVDRPAVDAWLQEKTTLFPFMQLNPQLAVLQELHQAAMIGLALGDMGIFTEFMGHYESLGGNRAQAWDHNLDLALATEKPKLVDAVLTQFVKYHPHNLYVFLLERGRTRTPLMLRKIIDFDPHTLPKALDALLGVYLAEDLEPPIGTCVRANRLLCVAPRAMAAQLLSDRSKKAIQKVVNLYESTIYAPGAPAELVPEEEETTSGT